jgi:hypothetical protein
LTLFAAAAEDARGMATAGGDARRPQLEMKKKCA